MWLLGSSWTTTVRHIRILILFILCALVDFSSFGSLKIKRLLNGMLTILLTLLLTRLTHGFSEDLSDRGSRLHLFPHFKMRYVVNKPVHGRLCFWVNSMILQNSQVQVIFLD